MRPIIGSARQTRTRTPRTMDEAYGWRAPLTVERRRVRIDMDYIIGAIATGVITGLLVSLTL